jgi:hypothetical protein
LTKKKMQKIGTAEMKFLTNLIVYTLEDPIRNTVIRNKLTTFNLNNTIQNNRINWIHHIERIEPERIPKQLMDHTPRGKRTFRRLMLCWKNGMEWIQSSEP